jgi:ABC-type phosphate transport system substrate-binding protein
MDIRKCMLFPLISALIVLGALCSTISYAFDDYSINTPFLYFAEPTPMPDEWIKQKIQYEDWAKDADLAVTLDQHLYPIMLPFIQKYAREKGIDIPVKEGTCGISAGMLSKKTVDMAGFCCPPGKTDRLPGLKYHTIGIAPLAITVHSDNPIGNVTEREVRGLFAGEITNWAEIGDKSAPPMAVRPVARLHCKARPGHWRLILDNEDLFSPDLTEVGSIEDMLIDVSTMKGSIGHVATWNIHKYRNEWKVKALRVNDMSPYDSKSLENGTYPFYRPYNITTWEAEDIKNPRAEDLLNYLLQISSELDKEFGMVPADRLKNAGWKFIDNELVGEPE